MGIYQRELEPEFSIVDPPKNNSDLENEITLLAGHINAATYRFLKLIAEFDKREAWGDFGIKSCAHWLNWKCGIAIGAAREKVRVARRLAELPQIDKAFSTGALSYSKVRAMTRVATKETEEFLLMIAEAGTANHMELLVRKKLQVDRLNSEQVEEVQHASRAVSCHQDENGMWIIHAKLPPEEGALVVKALEAIVDNATEAQDDNKEKNVSAETLLVETVESFETDSEPKLTFSQKRADALCSMAEHYIASYKNEAGIQSLAGAERCQIMLHVDINTLMSHTAGHKQHNHLQHCNLNNQWISAATARRLSCDASLVTVLEDEFGNVLNIGRRSRTIPPAIKRALSIRDTTCRYPGCCERQYVDAHHIKHWADGGETRLDNLVTLCRHHHRKLHQGAFEIVVETGIETAGNSSRIIFKTSCGDTINSCFLPQFHEDVSAETNIIYLADNFGWIDETIAASRWAGDKMDYSMALDALMG